MIIKNVQVFTEEGKFEPGEIIIENGIFQDTATNQDEVIDGQGGYAIPGLTSVTEQRRLSVRLLNTKRHRELQRWFLQQ